MGKTFKSFRPLDHRQEWRRGADHYARQLHSPADVLTALRGIEGWQEMFPFVERRLRFAWKDGQRQWVWSELEKHDAEQQRQREQAAAREVDWRCALNHEHRWRGDRSIPADCPVCGAAGELALDQAEPEAPKGIVLA
jgi:hypothetical protein